MVNVVGAANGTELRLRTPLTTLSGGGQIVLGTAGNNYILGDAGTNNVLVNLNNTISGVGNVGGGSMTLVNKAAGVINANQTSALTVNVNGGVTNLGTLEATNTGGLFILNTSIDNTGAGDSGRITASTSGSHVDLQNSTILGGVLSSVAGAQIDVVLGQAATLDGSQPGAPVTIASGTNVNVNNNAYLYLAGSIVNAGSINLAGAANATDLRLDTPVTTLSGGGQVVLGSAGNNFILGNGGALNELDNINNTISGAGNVGAGDMTLVNETAGLVVANQTTGLTLNANGGITNQGVLKDTGTGGLLILNSTVDGTQNGNAGLINATGAGAHVDLQNSTIVGGTLSTSGTGAVIDVLANQTATLDGSVSGAPITIAAGSTVQVNNNSYLYLRGTINNAGTIDLGVLFEPNNTDIRLVSPVVTLTGGGVVNLANSANNYIVANDIASETLNNVNNIIQGSGNIGAGSMTLINGVAGIIDANQAPGVGGSGEPGQLVLQDSGGVTNNGLIESTAPAGATLGGDLFILNTLVDNTGGGKIAAAGSSTVAAIVDLQNSTLRGGTLVSNGGPSKFEVVTGQSATLDGTVGGVNVDAVVNVLNNSTLYLEGAINTAGGSINLLGAANGTDIQIASTNVTLTGGGQINLGTSANDYITSNGYQNLFNVSGLIFGAGNIGNGSSLQLTNESGGVINANQVVALILQESRTVENYGVIGSSTGLTNAGGLFVVNTTIDNTIVNGSGVLNTGRINASGFGHVDLQNSTIDGGVLSTSGSGYIDVVAGQSAGFDGAVAGQALTIATGTIINVNNNSTLTLYGTINNAGTINLNSAANSSVISLNSSIVTLGGGGLIDLAGSGGNNIYEAQGNAELNNLNNTIYGAGAIGGGGQLYLVNGASATIDATVLGGGIAINLGGVQMVNAGDMVTTGGFLTVANSVFNTGSIIADSGNVTIGGNVNGAGSEIIAGAAKLEIGESVGAAAAQAVTFASTIASGPQGVFKIDNAQDFTGTIAGLETGDTIDLGNVALSTASLSYSGTAAGGTLVVTDGTTTSTLSLVGNYSQANFHLVNDGSGHTNVTYSGPTAGLPLVDTSLNLSGAELDTLQTSSVAKIIVSDDGLSSVGYVRATVAQITSDAGALSKLVFADGQTINTVKVTDNAAALAPALNSLNSDVQVGRINIADNLALPLTAAQLSNDTKALGELFNKNGTPVVLQVSDTAINLSDGVLGSLQANPAVTSIVVTDNGASGAGFVRASVAQFTADQGALAKLTFANGQTTGTVKIADTGAAISTALNALNGSALIGRINITDDLPVTVSVAQLTSDAHAISLFHHPDGTAVRITVSDTATAVSDAELGVLQANPLVTSIVVSDNGVSGNGFVRASVAQFAADGAALAELKFANGQSSNTVKIADTAANISTALNSLNGSGLLGRINITDDRPVAVTVAQLTSDAHAIGLMLHPDGTPLTLDVKDTTAHLNGASINNLTAAGDIIDATDLKFATLSATFTENGAGTAGTLNLSDGAHTAAVTLFGQFAAAGFTGSAAAAGFTASIDGAGGTQFIHPLAVPH